MHACRCPNMPEEDADALEVALQTDVSYLTLVLEAELGSIEERTLSEEPSPLSSCCIVTVTLHIWYTCVDVIYISYIYEGHTITLFGSHPPQWVTSQSYLLDSAHPCLKKAAVYFHFGGQYNEVIAY